MYVAVIDSSKTLATMTTNYIRECGYDAGHFRGPQDLLGQMKSGAVQVDVVITNLEQEGMTGLELCWHLRSGRKTEDVYTIVTSSSDDVEKLAEALDSGADEFIRKPFRPEELWARLRMASRLIEKNKELRRLANHEPMTGLYNRRAFLEYAGDMIDETEEPLAFLIADIDHFKRINDQYGHDKGDEAIIAMSRCLSESLPDGAVVARLGGEEFGALFGCADDEMLGVWAENIRANVSYIEIENGAEPITFTTSLGGGLLRHKEKLPSLLKRADKALYDAKENGRDQFVQAKG